MDATDTLLSDHDPEESGPGGFDKLRVLNADFRAKLVRSPLTTKAPSSSRASRNWSPPSRPVAGGWRTSSE